MRRLALLAVLASIVASSLPLLVTPSAIASFHLVSIREVFPGTVLQPDVEYVEFQAYAAGQNFLAGHSVTLRDKNGVTKTEIFDANVSDGRNQMTFVMATPAAESQFGIVADDEMAPNLIDPLGGAICWEALDCVSWGSFKSALPSPAGSPAASAGIPSEQALRRTIALGCATLLEPLDDRNDSALDFSPVFPAPRPNYVAPPELPCDTEGPVSKGGSKAPRTFLKRRPPQRTRDRTPTFRFSSNEAGSTFQCKLDGKQFKSCSSPFTTRRLSFGRHAFQVRARDSTGSVDASPALDSFRVIRPGQ